VKAPPKSRYEEAPPVRKPVVQDDEAEEEASDEEMADDDQGDDEELSSIDGDLEDASDIELGSDAGAEVPNAADLLEGTTSDKQPRKRKRKGAEDDLEGRYMQKLAKEEEKEEEERQAERRLKRQRTTAEGDSGDSGDSEKEEEDDEALESEEEEEADAAEEKKTTLAFPSDVPQHESLAPSKDAVELEKAARTVFLANVSTLAITSKTAKKTLLEHMGSFIDALPTPPEGKPAHKVESIRFRSTAYAGTALPKKAAFAKKELMDATTKSTNAYVVYSTAFAAREAVKKLNGTIVLDRHLRVDGVAHPAKVDHRRCVFVGNLGFVDDESLMDEGGEGQRKRSKIPSDIEEGLWRQFGKAGKVESVRVVRDEKTRVGKGFAYVQFEVCYCVPAQYHILTDFSRTQMLSRPHSFSTRRNSLLCCPVF
jgi:nucleolar protein 12